MIDILFYIYNPNFFTKKDTTYLYLVYGNKAIALALFTCLAMCL